MSKGMSTVMMKRLATELTDNIKGWAVYAVEGVASAAALANVTATSSTGMICRTNTFTTSQFSIATNATGVEITVSSWATNASVVATAGYIIGYNTNAGAGATGIHFWTSCATQAIASTANSVSVGQFKIYISDVT